MLVDSMMHRLDRYAHAGHLVYECTSQRTGQLDIWPREDGQLVDGRLLIWFRVYGLETLAS